MNKPWEVFDSRIRSAMIARRTLPFRPVSDENKLRVLQSLLEQDALNEDRVIYIHLPFCNNLCSFCIYPKDKISSKSVTSTYCDMVLKQIQSLDNTTWVRSKPFNAIYFGGGTPTSVPVECLESILGSLKNQYPLSNDCEITVESTISDINPSMVPKLKNAGVNRISLGVQSFNGSVRKRLGRIAGPEQISETLAFIRQAGITNTCIDLMYHLENQDFEIWKNDLSLVSENPITGCSVYSYIAPTNRTKPSPIAEEASIKKEYDFFKEADDRLAEISGWERLTSVQYGHREQGKAVYVVNQGKNADVLAFGSGAGGRINNYNYMQTGDLTNDPILFLSIDELYLKLRNIFGISESLGIPRTQYLPLEEYFEDIVQKLVQDDLICMNMETLSLTQTGRFWAANISAIFSQRIRDLILGV